MSRVYNLIETTFNNFELAATCTFDSGLCGWTQSKTDDLDWTDGHGRTPSGNTGPSTDHLGSTSGNAVSDLFNAVSDLF